MAWAWLLFAVFYAFMGLLIWHDLGRENAGHHPLDPRPSPLFRGIFWGAFVLAGLVLLVGDLIRASGEALKRQG